jgi:hypothetical protein
MAYKLTFAPYKGLSFIWNVSQHVGWKKTCPNRPTDVELCQFLFKQLHERGIIGAAVVGSAQPPTVTGVFDSALGFWIYLEQDVPGATADGVISPAKGVSYGSNVWLIAWLNYQYFKAFPAEHANLDKDSRLSMGLRAELAKTTP